MNRRFFGGHFFGIGHTKKPRNHQTFEQSMSSSKVLGLLS